VPKIVFLYKLREGPATASFGLNVAALAGVPPPVIGRAAEIAEALHAGGGFAALIAQGQGGRGAGAEVGAEGSELKAVATRLLALLRSGAVTSDAVRDLQRLALTAGR
jgi:DNA mismatch repair ATPase MutS